MSEVLLRDFECEGEIDGQRTTFHVEESQEYLDLEFLYLPKVRKPLQKKWLVRCALDKPLDYYRGGIYTCKLDDGREFRAAIETVGPNVIHPDRPRSEQKVRYAVTLRAYGAPQHKGQAG